MSRMVADPLIKRVSSLARMLKMRFQQFCYPAFVPATTLAIRF